MYLATVPMNDKSYDDWRKEMREGTPTSNDVSLTRKEVETSINKAEKILSNFNPYK